MTNKMTTDKAVEMIDERIYYSMCELNQYNCTAMAYGAMNALDTIRIRKKLQHELDQWKQLKKFITEPRFENYWNLKHGSILCSKVDRIVSELKKENAELKEILKNLAKYEITPKTHAPLWYDIRSIVNCELMKNMGCITISAGQKNDTLSIIADKITECIKNKDKPPSEFIATHKERTDEFYAMVLYESRLRLIWMDEDLVVITDDPETFNDRWELIKNEKQ